MKYSEMNLKLNKNDETDKNSKNNSKTSQNDSKEKEGIYANHTQKLKS